jgi:TetR/AcrR family transcriptional repressor of uid operon
MPKLKPTTQAARREHILDAAERCFARAGFHRTTMQDICREAEVSAGALYVYFSSKEELIAGIAERDRATLAQQLAKVSAAPDLLAALAKLGEYYSLEQPRHKRILCIEIGAESTRNPVVSEIFRSVDRGAIDSLEQIFARARDEGRIAPKLEPRMLAEVVALLGDGLFWRRAVDPDHDAEAMLPVLLELVATLLAPVPEHANKEPGSQEARVSEAAQ